NKNKNNNDDNNNANNENDDEDKTEELNKLKLETALLQCQDADIWETNRILQMWLNVVLCLSWSQRQMVAKKSQFANSKNHDSAWPSQGMFITDFVIDNKTPLFLYFLNIMSD
ncbi:hypothetical protein RFI_34295, partial [Reticulomyxa filosa]